MNLRNRKAMLQRAVVSKNACILERLEERVMLAADTWLGTVSNKWNVAGNWSVGVPAAGDIVIFGTSATVQVDKDYAAGFANALGRLEINGGASVVLAFDHNNASFHVFHDIELHQVAASGTSLKLTMQNVGTNTATVEADNLQVDGDMSGWNICNVDTGVSLTLDTSYGG